MANLFEMTLPVDTPIDSNGNTDETVYRSMIEWYVDGVGINSLFIDGTTGGWPFASMRDRKIRHQIGIDAVHQLNGKAAVNIATNTVGDSLELAEGAVAHGADRLVAMLPSCPGGMSSARCVEFCLALSERLPADTPWGLYEFRAILGNGFDLEALLEIIEFNNPPSFIKWTNPTDPFEALRMAESLTGDDFDVVPSHELALVRAIENGANEFVSGALVPLPELALCFEELANRDSLPIEQLSACQRLVVNWLEQLTGIADSYDSDFFSAIKAALAARYDDYPLRFPAHKGIDPRAVERFKEEIPKITEVVTELAV